MQWYTWTLDAKLKFQAVYEVGSVPGCSPYIRLVSSGDFYVGGDFADFKVRAVEEREEEELRREERKEEVRREKVVAKYIRRRIRR